MSRPTVWWWPVLAGIGVAIALLASSSRAVAEGAATVAVVAAALAVVETVLRQRRAHREEYDPTPAHPGGLREAFTGGVPGREDLILACDLLERKLSRPDLRARTAPEIASLVQLPSEEFRRYVAQRLDELEAGS